MKWKDARSKMMGEILNGIKVWDALVASAD